MVGAPVRRRQVAYGNVRGLSIRRACALLSVARSTLRYESRLVKRDAPVVSVMRELAAQYPRYGYRRIQVFLARRGHVMSADRTHRLWRLHGLQVPRKRPRRRVAAHRPRPLAPSGANRVWAYDFLFDACANGQQLKCLTVIDEYTRECLAIDVAGSIRSSRVIEVLSKLVSVHGAPKYLRSDNGPEFISRAILRWVTEAQIDTAYIDPGKPWQNGSNESFNGKFRDECLGMQWFKNRIDAKILIEEFRRQFNEVRPHSSLGQLTPAEFKQQLLTTDPNTAVSKDVQVRRKPAGQYQGIDRRKSRNECLQGRGVRIWVCFDQNMTEK
jgi:putative transposase